MVDRTVGDDDDEGDRVPQPNQKVLVIDDSKPIHALIRARLAGEPIELHFADSSADGLARARELRPDLVLLDVDLGAGSDDGFTVCAKLKADPATMPTPIIFLSGAAGTEEKIRGLDLGAVDYVTKPFDPAELRARVRASLRTKYLLDLLAAKAQIDGLTGLWNRTYFDERLRNEVALGARTQMPLACLMVDIDHFKQCNDRHGHPFGDEVLRAVAACLQECARGTDVVCRYGGEEFGLVLPDTPPDGALVVAERLRARIEALTFNHKGSTVRVTASFGGAAATIPADSVNTDPAAVAGATVTAADGALYQAKRAGRNRVVLAPAPAMPLAA